MRCHLGTEVEGCISWLLYPADPDAVPLVLMLMMWCWVEDELRRLISCSEWFLMESTSFGKICLYWRRACGIVMIMTRVIIKFIAHTRTCLRAEGSVNEL